jgi:hypothetical protein
MPTLTIVRTKLNRVALFALIIFTLSNWYVLPGFTAYTPAPPDREVTTGDTASGNKANQKSTNKASELVKEDYGNFPLHFEENQGQAARQVKFISRGSGYALLLSSDEAVMIWGSSARRRAARSQLSMRLLGANKDAETEGVDRLPGISNYFVGNDPSKWRTHVPNYAGVQYRGIYPGIDLVYYGNQRRLEYDFWLAPGSHPNMITLQFKGARRLRLNETGDLIISTGEGEVRQLKPSIYQVSGATRQAVAGRYVLKGAGTVGFQVGAYDRDRMLVIDPVIEYATFLGGSGDDRGLGIAADSQGNAYVAGLTTSLDYPTAGRTTTMGGTSDAFVTKLSPDGNLRLWSVYYGGSGSEQARGVSVDAQGDAYITGVTDSMNLPYTTGAYQTLKGSTATPVNNTVTDAFVAKFSADGMRVVYSTYLGGWRPETGDAIAVDAQGCAYVTGNTGSYNSGVASQRTFPTTAGAFQTNYSGGNSAAFVTKLNPAGNGLEYSTFLGGFGNNASSSFGDTAPDDLALGIVVDSAGNAVVTGRTESEKFPVLNAIQPTAGGGLSDAFVTKLNANGTALIFSTFLGGAGEENRTVGAIGIDVNDNVYLTGATNSINFPVNNAIQPSYGGNPENEAFVTKLNGSGALIYSTYLGSSNFKRGFGIAADPVSNVYVTGTNLLRKISANGTTLLYSRTLNGEGRSVALDTRGNIYVTGLTTTVTLAAKCSPGNFCPSSENVAQPNPGGGVRDAFVIKFSTDNHAPLANAGLDQTVNVTAGAGYFTLDGSGSSDSDGDALSYEWKDGGGNVVGTTAQVPLTRGLGPYIFTLTVRDGRGGIASDTVEITVKDQNPPVLNLPGNITVAATTSNGANVSFTVTATDDIDGPVIVTCNPSSPHLFGIVTSTVTCTATDSSGNVASGSFQVTVITPQIGVQTKYIDFERYPGGDGVYGTGDAGEECTVDGQDIGSRYLSMGVTFTLTDGNTPVINDPAIEYVLGSPRTLRPMNVTEYATSPGNQRLLKDFDITFTPGQEVTRVKLTALNADEAWSLIAYDVNGAKILSKKREAGSDRSVRSLELVTNATLGYISRVRVDICNGQDSCGGEGPESFDLLEYDPVVPPSFSNTRFIDFEKTPGTDNILGTADDPNTFADQSISNEYQSIGVNFQLRDGTAPVIHTPSANTIPGSPRTLYPVSVPGGSQTLIQDLIINFAVPVSRVKFAAIDPDEPWDIKVYSTSGALIRTIHEPERGNTAVYVEIQVDPCSAPADLIGRVEIIPTKSSVCCHSGPEFYDQLEFDVADLTAPMTIAKASPGPNAVEWSNLMLASFKSVNPQKMAATSGRRKVNF